MRGYWRNLQATLEAFAEGREAAGGWLRERLARYRCPKSVDFVATLPRNPSGRLLKRVLRQPCWDAQARQVA